MCRLQVHVILKCIALDSRWILHVLYEKLALQKPEDQAECTECGEAHQYDYDDHSKPSLLLPKMCVLPDNVCRLRCLCYPYVLLHERKVAQLNRLVIGILRVEGAVEVSRHSQLIEVLILVVCHLLLNLLRFFKLAFFQSISPLL